MEMANSLRLFVKRQFEDHSSVKPECRNDGKGNIYLVSPAGALKIRFRTTKELIKFRDNYVNRFSQIKVIDEYFHLYNEIRDIHRTKLIANLRTRFRGFRCNLLESN